jgi:hypothetical protein
VCPFAGPAAVALPFVRIAWTKISGACLATESRGSVRTAVNGTDLETNKIKSLYDFILDGMIA